MKIRLLHLDFDGVGPFKDSNRLDSEDQDKIFVYAPNNIGKTSSIDLIRWLLQGDTARDAFRGLEKDWLMNRERMAGQPWGRVEARVMVEGRGTFDIARVEKYGDLKSKLTVEAVHDDGSKEPVGSPEMFLKEYFPPERVGFNLLTGEHLDEFQSELRGDRVRESIEKLLHFPEISTAHEVMSGLSDRINATLNRLAKADKKAQRAKDELDTCNAEIARVKQEDEELVRKIERVEEEERELNERIGRLQAEAGNEDAIRTTEEAIKNSLEQQDYVRRQVRERLNDAWRIVAVEAAKPQAKVVLKEIERHERSQTEWQAVLGEIRTYEGVLKKSQCICLRPIDDDTKKGLRDKIVELGKKEPDSHPADEVDRWLLNSWTVSSNYRKLIKDLKTLHGRLRDLERDQTKYEKKLVDEQALLDEGAQATLRRLREEVADLTRRRRSMQDDRAGLVTERKDLEARLKKARQAAGQAVGASEVEGMATAAAEYASAFRAVIDRAIPWYRDQLEARVQDIFRRLNQRDANAVVKFDERSFTPHVQWPSADSRAGTKAVIGEGHRTRLGLALLLGLRDVASEKPFLVLDAPFSPLDPEGQHRLLEVLAENDSQVIIYCKDQFSPRTHQLIEGMDPVVYQMDWTVEKGKFTNGFTTMHRASPEVLAMEVTA